MTVATLDDLRDEAIGRTYPRSKIMRCESALVLFSAAFAGRQDCVWIAEAGITATCVDEDADKLAEMRALYPDGWAFVTGDVYEFARLASATGGVWDLVSVDPWTQDFARCAELLPLWCSLARRLVVLGTGALTTVDPPDGWRVSETRWRSDYYGGVFWTVLERA